MSSQLFTAVEVETDILEHEGAKIRLKDRNWLFLRKYSDEFHNPLPESATANQLNERVKAFVTRNGVYE